MRSVLSSSSTKSGSLWVWLRPLASAFGLSSYLHAWMLCCAVLGKVSYRCSTAKGLSTKFLSVFDLELPADFKPYNGDGEVNMMARLRWVAAEWNRTGCCAPSLMRGVRRLREPDVPDSPARRRRCKVSVGYLMSSMFASLSVLGSCLGWFVYAEDVVVLVPPAVDGFTFFSFSNPSSDSTRAAQHL